MGLFDKFKRSDLAALEQFAASHEGVEAYLEPKTPTMPESLLMVAADGEWARAALADRGQASALCKKISVPLYDAAVVGYPERMRGRKGRPAPKAPSAAELEDWFTKSGPEEPDS